MAFKHLGNNPYITIRFFEVFMEYYTKLLLFFWIIPLLCGCQPQTDSALSEGFTLVSHRGVPSQEEDHTFAGYDLAIQQGTQWLELDISATADGFLAISHDTSFCPDGGETVPICQLTLEELSCHTRPCGEPIYELDGVFARYQDEIGYVLDVKSLDDHGVALARMLALITEYDLFDRMIVESFHTEYLQEISAAAPSIPLILLLDSQCSTADLSAYLIQFPALYGVGLEAQSLTRERVELIHQHGKRAFAFFHDEDEAQFRRILSLGADGAFSDYTQRSLTLLAE